MLDTNVLSELMRPASSRVVVQWVASQERTTLCATSVTQAEILHGIRLLLAGRKRRAIEGAAEAMFREDFFDRILGFDSDAARSYVDIVNERRKRGGPISQFDAQIAAIVRVAGATLATHHTRDLSTAEFAWSIRGATPSCATQPDGQRQTDRTHWAPLALDC